MATVADSILGTINRMLGGAADYDHFDTDIKVFINNELVLLNQIGVGKDKIALVMSEMDTWDSIIGGIEEIDYREMIKAYIYHKVRMAFDPPTNPSVIQATKDTIKELEWRLNVQAENNEEEEE